MTAIDRIQFATKCLAVIFGFTPNLGSGSTISSQQDKEDFVSYYTATTLPAGRLKVGFESAFGLTDHADLQFDSLAILAGAPNAILKWQIIDSIEHQVSLGLGLSYLSRSTLFWQGARENFEDLEAKILRPQISWTRSLSERLSIHTHWSFGLGTIHAELSEQGRRSLWEAKYPNGNYDQRSKGGGSSNQADVDADYALSHRGLQLQSLLGFGRDFFQLTGEWRRNKSRRLFITSRIEQVEVESLQSKGFRLTIAQQWSFSSFHIRIGGGLQYQSLSGRDLDEERLSDSGFQPTTDIDLYWLL